MRNTTIKYLSSLAGLLLLSSVASVAVAAGFSAAASQDFVLEDSVCSADALGALTASDLAELMKASPVSVPLPATPLAERSPIVITVPGIRFSKIGWGPLEFSTFLSLADFLFSDTKAAGRSATNAAIKTAFDEYNSRFDSLYEAAAGADQELKHYIPTPDTYLEDRLAQSPACNRITVIPFPWSRDPGDSRAAVARFIPQLIRVYDTYKNSGRPIYILSHSWGSVIMHDVLHRVASTRPDVRIDKFLTLGTPLIPGNIIIDLFKRLEVSKEGLQKEVRKPANVRYWKNVWSSRDPFSNTITAADVNVQVDARIGAPESKLTDLILYGAGGRRLEAKTDLIAILNVRLWHKSYFNDYKAYLKTLNQDIYVKVFDPEVAKQLTNCPGAK